MSHRTIAPAPTETHFVQEVGEGYLVSDVHTNAVVAYGYTEPEWPEEYLLLLEEMNYAAIEAKYTIDLDAMYPMV